jgi:hypothetical protein
VTDWRGLPTGEVDGAVDVSPRGTKDMSGWCRGVDGLGGVDVGEGVAAT